METHGRAQKGAGRTGTAVVAISTGFCRHLRVAGEVEDCGSRTAASDVGAAKLVSMYECCPGGFPCSAHTQVRPLPPEQDEQRRYLRREPVFCK